MGWQWWGREKEPPSALKSRDMNISSFLRGIKWFLEKQESKKIWAWFEISQGFVIGLEVSFLGDFASLSLRFFLSLCLEFWNPGLAIWQSLQFTILYPYFYIGGVQGNKSPLYITLPLTIKISLTVQFQTQQLGFYTDMYNVPVRLLKHPAFLISLYQFQLTSSLTAQYFLQPAKCYYY